MSKSKKSSKAPVEVWLCLRDKEVLEIKLSEAAAASWLFCTAFNLEDSSLQFTGLDSFKCSKGHFHVRYERAWP